MKSFFLNQSSAKEEMKAILAGGYKSPIVGSGKVSTTHIKAYSAEKCAVHRTYEKLNPRERALFDLVSSLVKSEPFHASGRTWAARSQAFYADKLGVCTDQVRRIAKSIPLRSMTLLLEGKRCVLLRVAEPGDLVDEDFARIMASVWMKKKGKRPDAKEYGCLVHMAREAPVGWAPDIFSTVLENWSEFCAGMKLAIFMAANSEGDHFDPDPAHFNEKFLPSPHIPTIRRFWHVAMEYHLMRMQDEGLEAWGV
ncbi:hypothetical protein [Neotabrizicola shimadae]|uniref:Uncharacterized protein n=1 Tax=Neotabrizicola shimadae TaxID=2807096 RepID=A0A8G1EBW6_9RHOB|nr:hypothetical protein [Neotabrizicola shimadae]QYZ68561.1 hypothetical protein JO391_12295 [Neotabrizicola shimadae]